MWREDGFQTRDVDVGKKRREERNEKEGRGKRKAEERREMMDGDMNPRVNHL